MAREGREEDERGDQDARERREERVRGRLEEAPRASVCGIAARERRVDDEAEGDDERGAAELGHQDCLFVVLGRALRHELVRDEDTVLERSLHGDVTTRAEEVGNRAPVDDGQRVPCPGRP